MLLLTQKTFVTSMMTKESLNPLRSRLLTVILPQLCLPTVTSLQSLKKDPFLDFSKTRVTICLARANHKRRNFQKLVKEKTASFAIKKYILGSDEVVNVSKV